MRLLEIAEMLAASGYPYTIIVDDLNVGETVGKIFNLDNTDEPVGEIEVNPVGDYVVRGVGIKEVTFVTPIDVIMWIVQML